VVSDTPLAIIVEFDDRIEQGGERADRLLIVGTRIHVIVCNCITGFDATSQHMEKAKDPLEGRVLEECRYRMETAYCLIIPFVPF